MMKTTVSVVLAAFAAYFFIANADAQSKEMYRYTDENGTVVFTDKEPVGEEATRQAIPAGQPPQGSDPYIQAEPAAEPSLGQQRREEITREKQTAQAAQAVKEAQCTAWKEDVETLAPHRRHYYTNEKGETERLDDVERANRVAWLNEQIAANCP